MCDGRRQPLREVDVANEPHHAVEQEVLHSGIKLELQGARYDVVERVDLVVDRGHAVAVAHGGKGGGDPRRAGAGLVGNAHHERGAAAVDDGIGELGDDDLAAQAV